MFRFPQSVLFRHCDPAGIVFYPRYFEMMNDCVEAFFAGVVGWPFAEVHKDGAVPTAEIRTRFTAPSRLGDALTLSLAVTRVGRTSCGIAIDADCAGNPRFSTELTLVNVNAEGRPIVWPEDVKSRLTLSREEQEP